MNKASIRGVFSGCMLTTLAYVLFSSSFSLWSTQNAVSSDYVRTVVVSPSIYNKDLVPSISVRKRKLKLSSSQRTRTAEKTLVFSSQTRRKLVLPVVPTSIGSVQVTYHVLNESWWQTSGDYKMLIGTANGYQAKGDSPKELHEVQECSDFSSSGSFSGTNWTAFQLFCLLENIYRSFFSQYEWFVITPPSTYLSTKQLERLLVTMDPLTIVYMGHPSSSGYCMGGPGIVLSRVALEGIVPHLENCLQNGSTTSVGGDEALGNCFMAKLQTSCYVQDEAEEYFVDNGLDEFSSNWEQGHSNFITVFPVQTDYRMNYLYQVDLLRELEYQLEKVKSAKERLYGSSICKPQTLTPQVQPATKVNELNHWDAFEPAISYVRHLEPRDWYDGELKKEMESVSREGLRQYNAKMSSNLDFSKVKYGMHRYLGTKGKEYIIDVDTKQNNATRLHILRSHTVQPILLEDSGPEALNKTIDFVVPVSNVQSRLTEFMHMYEDVCLKVEENCRLNLVVYGENKDIEPIKEDVAKTKAKYPLAQINVIAASGRFSRGRALHTGILTLNSSDLAFTCDVDMTLERSFLNRCRRNAIQGRRVYFPEVFKYYNMDYVYRFKQRPRFSYFIDRYHGHWCTYGFGMQCIYKSDYDVVGGYDVKIEGWGGEDISLTNSVLLMGYEIMRAPEPALSHRYHPKICSKKLSKAQYGQCISSRDEDIADTRRLADYAHYLENYCGVKKKVWD